MRTLPLLIAVLVLGTPAVAGAQADFSATSLKSGDVLYITQSTGDRIQGVLTSISPWQLTLQNGTMLGPDDVLHIERRGDSLANGALIAGLVTGAWCAAVCGQGTASGEALVGAVAVTGGLGALVGALIDHSRVGRTTVFRRSPFLRVSPVATSTTRRLNLSIEF